MARDLKHVLYIDDEEDILTIATLALESVGGLRVTRCIGGEAGIAGAKEAKPDIILLDVMMPDMDGPSTLMKIQAEVDIAHIPVVFMTARVQPEDVKKYLDLGAAGVIRKPFDPMTLADQVKDIWRAL